MIKNNKLILLINQKAFRVDEVDNSDKLTQEQEPGKLTVASIYGGGSGWNTYSAALMGNRDIIVEKIFFYRIQGQLNTESQIILKVKFGEY